MKWFVNDFHAWLRHSWKLLANPGMPGTFSPPPRVSDSGMHHCACVTHVPWCMPGSLTSGSGNPKIVIHGNSCIILYISITQSQYHDCRWPGDTRSQVISSISIDTVSGADQRKHQSSASLAFLLGIHRWPLNSLHKWPVMWKMLPLDDVIMSIMFGSYIIYCVSGTWTSFSFLHNCWIHSLFI